MTPAKPKPPTPAPSLRENRFDWPLCYEAENFILAQLESFLERNHFAKQLADRMQRETGTLLLDWVDHLVLSPETEERLLEAGYLEDRSAETHHKAFWHPEAMLPRILLDATVATAAFPAAVAIRTESVSDFMAAQAVAGEPEGNPLSRFRQVLIAFENGTRLEAVERRGYRGYLPLESKAGQVKTLLKAHELWKNRPRAFPSDEKGYRHLHATLDRVIGMVGRDLACHVVFAEE